MVGYRAEVSVELTEKEGKSTAAELCYSIESSLKPRLTKLQRAETYEWMWDTMCEYEAIGTDGLAM